MVHAIARWVATPAYTTLGCNPCIHYAPITLLTFWLSFLVSRCLVLVLVRSFYFFPGWLPASKQERSGRDAEEWPGRRNIARTTHYSHMKGHTSSSKHAWVCATTYRTCIARVCLLIDRCIALLLLSASPLQCEFPLMILIYFLYLYIQNKISTYRVEEFVAKHLLDNV